MAVSNVELIVNATKAINPLRKVEQQSKKVEGAVRDMNGKLRHSKARFNAAGQSANKASRAFDGLAKKAAGLAAAYVGLNAAQNAVRKGIQRIESERRIEFLAKGYGEVEALQDAATKAAKRFGTGQTEANRALADVFARLRPVGVGLSDIVSVYNGFNTAARISGSTAIESASAFRQLSQALGSGALRGDEFNSIAEQVPGILTAISKETGIAQGQLRDFAAEGGITADVVIRALKRIEIEGAAQLEAALDGPAQAIADFQNAAEDVQVALTKDIVPQMAESFKQLAELIVNLEGPIRFIGGLVSNTLNQINSLIVQATKPAAVAARRDIEAGLIPTNIIAGLTGGDVRGGAKQLFGEAELKELEDRAREFSKLRGVGFQETLLQFMQDRLKTMDAASAPPAPELPNVPTVNLSTKGKKTKKTGKSDAEREAERLARIAEASANRVRSLQEQTLLAAALTEEERIQFERQIQIANILANNNDLNKEQLQTELQATLALYEQQDVTRAITEENERQAELKKQRDKEEAERLKKLQEQERKRTEELRNLYQGIGDTISNGVVEALQGAVRGTTSLAEAATNMLNRLADQMFQLATNMLLFGNITGTLGAGQGILGSLFGGFMANGGTVSGGKSYIVGERGPELFTPGRTGSIAPSGSFSEANVTINVDASGSSVEGKADQAAQLGKALSLAVQQELVKQKRPGGILAS